MIRVTRPFREVINLCGPDRHRSMMLCSRLQQTLPERCGTGSPEGGPYTQSAQQKQIRSNQQPLQVPWSTVHWPIFVIQPLSGLDVPQDTSVSAVAEPVGSRPKSEVRPLNGRQVACTTSAQALQDAAEGRLVGMMERPSVRFPRRWIRCVSRSERHRSRQWPR